MCFRGSPVLCGYVTFRICCRIVGRRVAMLRRHSARLSVDSPTDARLPQPEIVDLDAAAATAAIQLGARPSRKAAESIAPAFRRITGAGCGLAVGHMRPAAEGRTTISGSIPTP